MSEELREERFGAPAEELPAGQPDAGGAAAEPAVGAPAAAPAAARDGGQLAQVLEALVFVHRGTLTPKTVREALGEEHTAEEIAAGFAALREEYARRGGAIVLLEVAGGYQLGTREDLAPWIQKLDFYEHHRHLSRPTLETLAIIAYKQPVTRAEIEAIRGVNVERIVRNLIERKLVRILGHKDVPGRPMVLGTTREFLELFGINSLADLPPLKEFVEPPSDAGIDEELPPRPRRGRRGGGRPASAESEGEPAGDDAGAADREAGHGTGGEAGGRGRRTTRPAEATPTTAGSRPALARPSRAGAAAAGGAETAVRLQKFLSRAGVASRRAAEELIRGGPRQRRRALRDRDGRHRRPGDERREGRRPPGPRDDRVQLLRSRQAAARRLHARRPAGPARRSAT